MMTDSTDPVESPKDEESSPLTEQCDKSTETEFRNLEDASETTPLNEQGDETEAEKLEASTLALATNKCEEEKGKESQCSADEPAPVVTAPPDGGWGWVVVAASFVCNFFVDGIIFSFGVFLSEMMTSLEVTRTEVAIVGSLLSGFYLLAGPFVSALANKHGFRIVTIAGSILAFIGLISSSFAASIYELFFFYGFLGGIGFGMIYCPSILIVGFYFERWRALATGIAVCGSGIGMMVLSPIFTSLIESVGWRGTVRVQAAMVLSCIICGALFRPLTPLQIELEPDETDESGTAKKFITKNGKSYPTAAEVLLSKSTQSLSPSLIMTRVAALSGQTQSVPMIPFRKRNRTLSENSSFEVQERSRRGTVTEYIPRSRRGTLTKLEDVPPVNRPLYRDDIFFNGSLHRLADFKTSQRDFMGYTLSVTRLPTKKDLEEEEECTCFPEAIKRSLSTLFDTSLLKSPSFLMLCVSGSLTLLGLFTPFMYMQERATTDGMPVSEAVWLLSVVGVTNTVGRVICGVLSSCPCMDALLINNIALTVGGLATMASSLSLQAPTQFTFSAIFGFTLACFGSLRSIVVVDLLGIEKLTNAFGLLLLFQGLAAVVGTPLAGSIRQLTGGYLWSFIVAGGFILLSGLMCYPLKAISRWENRKRKEETDDTFV